MGVLSGILGGSSLSSGDLEVLRHSSFAKEYEKLKKLREYQQQENVFRSTEGIGFSEKPDIQFGYEKEVGTSRADRMFRATGLVDNTDLLI